MSNTKKFVDKILIIEKNYQDDERHRGDPYHWKYTLKEESELLGVDGAVEELNTPIIFFD